MSRINLTKTPKKRMFEKIIAAAPIWLAISMVGCVVDSPTAEEIDNPRPRSNVGTQYAAIVIVNAADKANPLSNSDAESMFNQASAQFAACSGNEMAMVLQDDIARITLPKSIGQYSSYSVDNDMNMMLCRHYGYSDDCEITKERDLDHVLFSLPFGLSDDKKGVFWAKGSAGDSRRFSVYCGGDYRFEGKPFNGGFFVPSTIMHELGHNYRLGHALDPQNDGNSPYGDSTSHMGGSAVTNKCFNGYNYYVLGWHQSQTNEISLYPNVAKRYNIRSISDLSSEGIVNIKVDKYYVTFNLKNGINSQTGEYENQVLIHEGKDIHFGQSSFGSYHDTKLVGNLESSGDRFEVQVSGGTLRIELCSMDTQGSGGANVSIGLGATNCNTDGPIQNPKGIQNLMSGVPVSGLSGAKNDILEFKMELSNTPDSVTCSTSGGTGDVDLLVNSMSSPQILYSKGVNSCYSRGTTTNQSCTTNELKGPDVYVTVEGDDPFSGVTLLCTATGATSVDSDLCPDDPYKMDPGICGCGTLDTDSDDDGTADCLDKCPNDPAKTEPGQCGCGEPEGDCDVLGNGLKGTYYDQKNFTDEAFIRLDPVVNFNWGRGAPDPRIEADTFSVRWTGFVKATHSETYTFTTESDDGIRLWVGDTLVIDNWTNHAPTKDSGTIDLTEGQLYAIKMEYFENGGGAVARLLWSSPSQNQQVIPNSQLFADDSSDLCPDDPYKTEPGECGCGVSEGSCGEVVNVALGKKTSQSSIGWGGESSRAVDGNTSGKWGDGSVTHTAREQGAWWEVYLGGAHRVEGVTLWNRTDCCSERLAYFHVDYLDEQGDVIATRSYVGQAPTTTDIDLAAQGVHAVRVQLGGTNYLSLAEVEVWGSGAAQETGDGLRGTYFDNANFTGQVLERVDATVDFNWQGGAPDASMGLDTFSVVWTGYVRAQYSEEYTFYTVSDDGVRLFVNDELVHEDWTVHAPRENSGTIFLEAGELYPIRMEYYENGGGAVAKLLWSSSSQPKQIVPQKQLFSSAVDSP